MTHSLTLGSRLLTGSLPDDEHDFVFNMLAEGTSFGVAAGAQEVITSLLSDGDLVRTTRFGNRQVTFPVEITGPDLASLAHGEAALRREIGRGNTLTWEAPDYAVPTVFDVIDSSMEQVFNDLDDLHRVRTFNLTLTCAPFARSASMTTVAALEVAAGATTVVDTCDSATGWESFINGSPAGPPDPAWLGISGGLWVYEIFEPGPQTLTLTRTGSFSVATTPYIVARLRSGQAMASVTASAVLDGTTQSLPLLSKRKVSGTNEHEYVFQAVGTTVTSLSFTSYSLPDYADFGVFDVTRTNQPPGQTPRQPSRIIDVGGTERTPGSLRISAPDGASPLNLTLVATWPDNGSGFSPPLRRWRTLGNTETTTAATFSGKTEPLWPNYVMHDIPVESLPDGTYQLMGLLRAGTTGDYRVESLIQSRHDGVTLGETTWGETVTLPAGQWMLIPMGHYRVPIVAAKAGEFRIGAKTPDGAGVEYDELWLFPMEEDCALTAVLPPEPHLWLDSADLETRVPQVFEGGSADKSDAHWPRNGVYTMGHHVFTPGRTAVFTATHGVDWPNVTLTYHKRWHSNAAEEG